MQQVTGSTIDRRLKEWCRLQWWWIRSTRNLIDWCRNAFTPVNVILIRFLRCVLIWNKFRWPSMTCLETSRTAVRDFPDYWPPDSQKTKSYDLWYYFIRWQDSSVCHPWHPYSTAVPLCFIVFPFFPHDTPAFSSAGYCHTLHIIMQFSTRTYYRRACRTLP